MKRTILLGKIDYNKIGRKNCPVYVDVELKEVDGKQRFSVCGDIKAWNGGFYCGGQCIDEIARALPHNKLAQEIHRLWKAYHLNDMHAGTPEQEKAVKGYFNGERYDYTKAVEYLKSIGLYEVYTPQYKDGKELYRYGHAWLYEAIPENDLEIIKGIIQAV